MAPLEMVISKLERLSTNCHAANAQGCSMCVEFFELRNLYSIVMAKDLC